MEPTQMCPLFCTARLDTTRQFYIQHLGFQAIVEVPGYVELQAAGEKGPKLAFMEPCPDGNWVPGTGKGLMYCFAVADADAEHGRLSAEGVPIIEQPEDRPWGERAFVATDPNGISLYFGTPIPAAAK